MESLREQILYGDHCMHGTAIGTPGGADLMCGYCEDGMTTWHEDIGYTLWFRFTDQDLNDDMGVPWSRITDWRASNPPSFDSIRPLRSMRSWWEMFNAPDISRDTMSLIQHKVSISSKGYWDA